MEISDLISKTKVNLKEIGELDKSLEENKKIREKKINREYVFYVDDLLEESGYEKYATGINKTEDGYYYKINEDKSATLIIRDDKLEESGKFEPFLAYVNLPNEKEVGKFVKNRHLLQNLEDYSNNTLYSTLCSATGALAVSFPATANIPYKSLGMSPGGELASILGTLIGIPVLVAAGIAIYRKARVKISQNYFNKNYKDKIVEGPDKFLNSDAFKPIS